MPASNDKKLGPTELKRARSQGKVSKDEAVEMKTLKRENDAKTEMSGLIDEKVQSTFSKKGNMSKPSSLKSEEAEIRIPKVDSSVPTNSKPTVSKPTVSKPTNSKPTVSKPTDSKPTNSKPTDSKPTDSLTTLRIVVVGNGG